MNQPNDEFFKLNDEMLPEYDLSQLTKPIRGKYAQAMRQGYSVTVHHPDGTSTTRHVPPQDNTNDRLCDRQPTP